MRINKYTKSEQEAANEAGLVDLTASSRSLKQRFRLPHHPYYRIHIEFDGLSTAFDGFGTTPNNRQKYLCTVGTQA